MAAAVARFVALIGCSSIQSRLEAFGAVPVIETSLEI